MSRWVKNTKNYVDGLPTLAFPFKSLPEIYCPQSTVLELANGRHVYVYQWCYLQRITRGSLTELNLDSLSNARVEAMPRIVDRLSKWFRFGGAQPQTVRTSFKALSQFMSWVDALEQAGRYEDVLTNADVALKALEGHHRFLRQSLQARKFSAASAGALDQRVINALSEIHGRTFLDDIEPLTEARLRGTCAPRDDEVAAFMSILQAIFDSAVQLMRREQGNACAQEAGQRVLCVWASDDSKVVALADDFSEARLMELACVAFAALAIGDSGANLAQIQSYEEPDDLEQQLAQPDRVNLTHKSIKLRAGGKPVPVHLTTTTLSRLRSYLQIRERLRMHLNTPDIAPMFVLCAYGVIRGRAGRKPESLQALPDGFLEHLRNKVQLIGVELPRITLRQLRAYKQQDVVRKRGVKVAAEVMGHSIVTAIRAYSNSQEEVRRSDMGQFLSSLSSRVLESSNGLADATSTVGIPPGSCGDHGNPVPVDSEPVVEPDCGKTEGCFFCAKFRVHADGHDSRKLLSCRYVLLKLAPLRGESAAADRVFRSVTDRIDAVLEEVRHRVPEVYEQARQDVEVRGALTRYWAAKLQQLYLLGMLSSAT